MCGCCNAHQRFATACRIWRFKRELGRAAWLWKWVRVVWSVRAYLSLSLSLSLCVLLCVHVSVSVSVCLSVRLSPIDTARICTSTLLRCCVVVHASLIARRTTRLVLLLPPTTHPIPMRRHHITTHCTPHYTPHYTPHCTRLHATTPPTPTPPPPQTQTVHHSSQSDSLCLELWFC